jgi:spore coat protein JB
MENMCKEDLMNLIQTSNFAVIDLALYLDTHPDSRCALDTFHDYHHTLMKAVQIYEKRFEPLTIYGVFDEQEWSWKDEPWPWQKECDC